MRKSWQYTGISSITRGFRISLPKEICASGFRCSIFDADSGGQKHGEVVVMAAD